MTFQQMTAALFGLILVGILCVPLPAAAQDDAGDAPVTEEAVAATEEATDAMPAMTEEVVEEATEAPTQVPTTTPVPTQVPTISPASTEPCPAGFNDSIEYRIQPQDTLSSIGRTYNVSAFCLATFNNIVNPSLIFWGSVIDVPVAGDANGTGGPATATPTPDPTANLGSYTVRQGDNLYRISLRFNTTIARLQALNPSITNPNVIFIGQQIVVPASS